MVDREEDTCPWTCTSFPLSSRFGKAGQLGRLVDVISASPVAIMSAKAIHAISDLHWFSSILHGWISPDGNIYGRAELISRCPPAGEPSRPT